MIPAGYMAKRVLPKPDWLLAPHVLDIYSVSGCVSGFFADYVDCWKHNGHWFFDSPQIITSVAKDESIDLLGNLLFYYEIYEKEFDGKGWTPYQHDDSRPTEIVQPQTKGLVGFDVVTFYARNAPECSPLSCNGLAHEIPTNSHCLLNSFQESFKALETGAFDNSEPGPYRIFAVYTVDWPED